jgi:hypothetical protein
MITRLLRERKLKKTKPTDGTIEFILGELLREKDSTKLQLALLHLQEKLGHRSQSIYKQLKFNFLHFL